MNERNQLQNARQAFGILSEKGREKYGHIFPDGRVPLKTLLPVFEDPVHVYVIDFFLIPFMRGQKLLEMYQEADAERAVAKSTVCNDYPLIKPGIAVRILKAGLPIEGKYIESTAAENKTAPVIKGLL